MNMTTQLQKARKNAPPHREFDERYKITGADYRNVFGNLLWQERPYSFKRLYGINHTFIYDYIEYRVHRVAIGGDGVIQYNIICIS